MHSAQLSNIRIILSHPTHPGNIGAAARAMKTMGVTKLYLVNPKRFPDRQADDMSAGAQDVLQSAHVCTSLDEALRGTLYAAGITARRRDLAAEMHRLREGAAKIMSFAGQGEVALVFGTEMSGLTNAELERCQILVTIPAEPGFSSLNLAAAVQLAAYELRMTETDPAPTEALERPARLDELERFYGELEKTLIAVNFLDKDNPRRLMARMRRLFARALLQEEEVNIWRGILNAIQRKVD